MPRNNQAAGASQPALEVHTCGPDVEITGIRDFDLDHIFDCGQCFRWNRGEDGSYTGTAYGRIVRMVWDPAKQMLRICGTTPEDFHEIWRGYLDLDRDYGQIKSYLAERDPVIRDAIGFGSGIRILNQEKWETVLSFLISQNNNIPRIRKCIDSLAETMGRKIGTYDGRDYYALPSPEVLAEAAVEDLEPCRLGYRAKYLIQTAKLVEKEGMDVLEALGQPEVTAEGARQSLCRYSGIGPKVANCISLFSMGKIDSFPIDVWVRKVMNRLYGIEEKNVKAMTDFASKQFCPYGGIAQQYLFYYITHKNGL